MPSKTEVVPKVGDGEKYGDCQAVSCNNAYHLEDNACASNIKTCDINNGKGEQMWDGMKYGSCNAKTCDESYHVENNLCMSNVRACDLPNAKGTETWDGQKYGACVFSMCNQGYQLSGNTCTVSLIGKFKSPCYDSGGVDVHYTNNFIDDTKHELIGTVFYNPGAPNSCTTPYRQVVQHGNYLRIGESPYVEGAVEIDFTKTNLTITLMSDLAVSEHNAIAYCGLTNWQKNVGQTVTYEQCNISSGKLVKSINQVIGDNLYVGDFMGGTDLTVRPMKLNQNPNYIFKRIQ